MRELGTGRQPLLTLACTKGIPLLSGELHMTLSSGMGLWDCGVARMLRSFGEPTQPCINSLADLWKKYSGSSSLLYQLDAPTLGNGAISVLFSLSSYEERGC